jgi:hypothetical protein
MALWRKTCSGHIPELISSSKVDSITPLCSVSLHHDYLYLRPLWRLNCPRPWRNISRHATTGQSSSHIKFLQKYLQGFQPELSLGLSCAATKLGLMCRSTTPNAVSLSAARTQQTERTESETSFPHHCRSPNVPDMDALINSLCSTFVLGW